MRAFEHTGYWWDPQAPETRWPGTLRFDSVTGAVLSRTMPLAPSQFFRDHREFDVIHGESATAPRITLLRCFERSHSDVFANAVITGLHAENADPLIVNAAVVIEHLDKWWTPSAITHDDTLRYPNVGVAYAQPADVEVHADADMRMLICAGSLPSFQRRHVSISEEIRLELRAAVPRPLSAFQRRVHACQDLLSIASLTLCGVEDFRISPPGPDGGKPTEYGRYYAVPGFKDPSEDWPEGLFTSADIKERLRGVFTGWLASAERLSAVRSLYLSAAYGKAFLELKLLALAQAAEAYHRRSYEGQDCYMDAGAYADTVAAPLQAAIPAGINSSLRQALKSRLTYGNEYSFRRRMTVLFKEHEAGLRAVTPTPCQWINTIVRYRNDLTHHPVVDEQPTLNRLELVQCNYVLRTLLELCFLKSMSLTQTEVQTLAEKSYRYQQIRERFFKDVK